MRSDKGQSLSRFGAPAGRFNRLLRENAGANLRSSTGSTLFSGRSAPQRDWPASPCCVSRCIRCWASRSFQRTDPGQFVINMKAPSGTRLELTEQYVKQVEDEIRQIVPPNELGMIVSNIGVTPGFSSIYTPNSAAHTAFVQVSLKEGHKVGSYEYMNRVRSALRNDLPEDERLFPIGWIGGFSAESRVACAD